MSLPRPAISPARLRAEYPRTSAVTRPVSSLGPTLKRQPNNIRRIPIASGAAANMAVAGARSCSTRSVMSAHAVLRSKSAGRTTFSPVGETLVTRSTRNVRKPVSVSAMKYQAGPLVAKPSG